MTKSRSLKKSLTRLIAAAEGDEIDILEKKSNEYIEGTGDAEMQRKGA